MRPPASWEPASPLPVVSPSPSCCHRVPVACKAPSRGTHSPHPGQGLKQEHSSTLCAVGCFEEPPQPLSQAGSHSRLPDGASLCPALRGALPVPWWGPSALGGSGRLGTGSVAPGSWGSPSPGGCAGHGGSPNSRSPQPPQIGGSSSRCPRDGARVHGLQRAPPAHGARQGPAAVPPERTGEGGLGKADLDESCPERDVGWLGVSHA